MRPSVRRHCPDSVARRSGGPRSTVRFASDRHQSALGRPLGALLAALDRRSDRLDGGPRWHTKPPTRANRPAATSMARSTCSTTLAAYRRSSRPTVSRASRPAQGPPAPVPRPPLSSWPRPRVRGHGYSRLHPLRDFGVKKFRERENGIRRKAVRRLEDAPGILGDGHRGSRTPGGSAQKMGGPLRRRLLTEPRLPWLPAGMLRVVTTGGLLLCSVAIYGGGHVTALTLPARDPVADADVERLAQSVAEHLMAADFDEPEGVRLQLSVRGDLLFVKGVVNRRSARRVHKALLTAPDVGVVVLTYVPGSAHDTSSSVSCCAKRTAPPTCRPVVWSLPAAPTCSWPGSCILSSAASRSGSIAS